MIPKETVTKLRELGQKVKTLLPGVNGSVQFNMGKNQPEPVVTVNLADVTEVRTKQQK